MRIKEYTRSGVTLGICNKGNLKRLFLSTVHRHADPCRIWVRKIVARQRHHYPNHLTRLHPHRAYPQLSRPRQDKWLSLWWSCPRPRALHAREKAAPSPRQEQETAVVVGPPRGDRLCGTSGVGASSLLWPSSFLVLRRALDGLDALDVLPMCHNSLIGIPPYPNMTVSRPFTTLFDVFFA